MSDNEQKLRQLWQQQASRKAEQIVLDWQAVKPQPSRKPLLWLATAATLVVAVSIGWWQQAESNLSAPPLPMLLAHNYQVDLIDQRLQQAYLRSASTEEIDQLWQQRAELTQ